MVTMKLLTTLCPKTKNTILADYLEPLNRVTDYYEISTSATRLASFLAQVTEESAEFNTIEENLNYSAVGLRKVFSKYFPNDTIANQYARKPEKIANRVYANRMKNGDEDSGDGWKFRGRGLIQITGRENYTILSQLLEMTLDETISYLSTPLGATAGAGWFWDTNKLNNYADKNDFIGLTKRINGGTIGIEKRLNYYETALRILQG